jgi:ribosomal protein S18 acetylase RimI-like enzyme
MRQNKNAEALLQAALTLPYAETLSLAVPAVNQEAIDLIKGHGFEQVRANRHMGRGPGEPPDQRKNIYAQTSLALG